MLVALSDGRDFEYAGVISGDGLDFVGIHIEAGHEDHVLLAVLDEHVTPLVEAADVTGAQPAIGQHDLGGLRGVVPVPGGYLRAAHADFPDLTDPELLPRVIPNGDLRRRNG